MHSFPSVTLEHVTVRLSVGRDCILKRDIYIRTTIIHTYSYNYQRDATRNYLPPTKALGQLGIRMRSVEPRVMYCIRKINAVKHGETSFQPSLYRLYQSFRILKRDTYICEMRRGISCLALRRSAIIIYRITGIFRGCSFRGRQANHEIFTHGKPRVKTRATRIHSV